MIIRLSKIKETLQFGEVRHDRRILEIEDWCISICKQVKWPHGSNQWFYGPMYTIWLGHWILGHTVDDGGCIKFHGLHLGWLHFNWEG